MVSPGRAAGRGRVGAAAGVSASRGGEGNFSRRRTSMPARNEDLHGSAPDRSDVALLLIDVINDLEFPEGDQHLRFALPMAHQIVALKRRARREGVPVVPVNDN